MSQERIRLYPSPTGEGEVVGFSGSFGSEAVAGVARCLQQAGDAETTYTVSGVFVRPGPAGKPEPRIPEGAEAESVWYLHVLPAVGPPALRALVAHVRNGKDESRRTGRVVDYRRSTRAPGAFGGYCLNAF